MFRDVMSDLAHLPKAESVTQLLVDDHRRLDDLLADAKRALAAADARTAAALFAEFRDGLEAHIVAEEHVLFPLFEELTGTSGGGPTHVMRMEHADIRKLLAEISAGLTRAAAAPADLATPLAHLTALLTAHNGKEERILYPASDRAARASGQLEELLVRLQVG
jgi:iron-sulfur cluster repair protein YtfE (RIC family)